jgi:hypothetical protein
MEQRRQARTRWSRRSLAVIIASTVLAGMPSPAAAGTFTWDSYRYDGQYAGSLTFIDDSASSKTGSDSNRWGFYDFGDGGYTHRVVLQANVNGTWVTKSHRFIADGASTGRISVNLPEGQIRFHICMYTPDGEQTSIPGCLYRYGTNG